ncbi:hypothetical protein [Klebsiella variicola]|uniref:hypothetical protein n=1 Tax=Klebsiella variicola TaxID=244366 RepID=UPI000A82F4A0|nr:hypothetical protein [Klebsiella variicola]
MTDITELAQSLKRRATSAKEFGESLFVKADDILALLEVLEKAQGMEAYWKTQCRGITDHCEVLQARIAELEEAEQKLCAANVTLDARAEFAEHQLAGLESRLDSADKLQDSAFRSGLQHGFSLGQTDDQKGYEQSMAAYSLAAGIKVEAE